MECQKITWTLLFLAATAAVGVLGLPADTQADRFLTRCLNDSVVVAFRQSPLNVRLSTVESGPGKEDSECSRTFTSNELAVKEFDFKKCNFGAKTIKIYAEESYRGIVFNSAVIKIDCKPASVGDAIGSLVGAYIDIFTH